MLSGNYDMRVTLIPISVQRSFTIIATILETILQPF